MSPPRTTGVAESAQAKQQLRQLVTPEGVPIEVEIAQVGSRIAAFAMDFGIMIGATVVVVLLLMALAGATGLESSLLALGILAAFFIWNGYFLFFEMRWRGSTPGKRAVGLRVVSRDGGPLTTGAVFARNLLRELELYLPLQMLFTPELLYGEAPGWALLGASAWIFLFLLMPLFNRDRARCGDLVAGTLVVVRPEAQLVPDPAEQQLSVSPEEDYQFSDEQLDMYGIKELQVLEEILQRDAYDPKREDLLRMVADKIALKIAWPKWVSHQEIIPFLQSFYRAQRRRLEGRLLLGERREHKKIGLLKKK